MKKEKKIELMGDTYIVKKHFQRVICVNPGGLSVHCMAHPFGKKDVQLGQELYDLHILQSNSAIFKINPEDKKYYVTPFQSAFAAVTEENRDELIKKVKLISELDEQISSSLKKRNSIIKEIKTCDI
jgi:hypothetical protein